MNERTNHSIIDMLFLQNAHKYKLTKNAILGKVVGLTDCNVSDNSLIGVLCCLLTVFDKCFLDVPVLTLVGC